MDAGRLLEGLNEAQLSAVVSTAQPLCILAGAGSGKTRVLTRRIAHRVATEEVEARHVLALTFTRKAASELNHRLRALGLRDTVAAGTFHGVAYAQLRARWADRGITPPSLLDRKVGFVARLLPPALSQQGRALDVVSEIEWAKARMVTPLDYVDAVAAAGRRPALDPSTVAELFDRYEQQKRARRMVDFDDLLRLCTRDLTDDPEFASTQRWRFRHLFVDEFQDVNPLQARLLDCWLGDRRDLCVVGDPNQAIYAWNGADPALLRELPRRYPGTEVVRLTVNYRSTPQILEVANAMLGRDERKARLRATRTDGPVPEVVAASSDRAEATAIARAVRDRHRPGARWADQAVLVRTHAQTALIEEALHAAQIPFRVRGKSGLLDQPEVRDALKGMGRAADFATALADLQAAVAETTDEDRAANLAALVRLAGDYANLDPTPSTGGFRAWLTTNIGEQPDQQGDAVDVGTFHAAKGLEWPIVHLAGVEQGLVPIGHAKTAEALAEEQRLFYVAITRAEHELRCYYAEERTFGTRTMRREPSLYLDRVHDACDRLRGERGERRAKPSRARRPAAKRPAAKGAPPNADVDPEILDALRSWRTAQAKAAAMPPYVIFHDRTLEAVAAAKPSSRAELLALPGLGPVKVSRYGDDLLGVVAAHRSPIG